MGGIELRNETPVVDREPNRLDRLASDFSGILDQFDIEHVYGTDDVAILTGRARSTEDIDVLIERVDAETAEELTSTFTANGFWGLAMPLGSMFEMLTRVT